MTQVMLPGESCSAGEQFSPLQAAFIMLAKGCGIPALELLPLHASVTSWRGMPIRSHHGLRNLSFRPFVYFKGSAFCMENCLLPPKAVPRRTTLTAFATILFSASTLVSSSETIEGLMVLWSTFLTLVCSKRTNYCERCMLCNAVCCHTCRLRQHIRGNKCCGR
jgi:hypothetical protein